jgi:small subunit ribosomal protein S19
MTRALWKGPFIQDLILKQVYKLKLKPAYTIIKIWTKNSTIFPSFLGLNFKIYNGKIFISIVIKKNMIGLKFGEFILTRKTAKHK